MPQITSPLLSKRVITMLDGIHQTQEEDNEQDKT